MHYVLYSSDNVFYRVYISSEMRDGVRRLESGIKIEYILK